MHGQIRLLIPLYIKSRHSNRTCDGLLENGSANNLLLPCDFARKSDVYRQELHYTPTRDMTEYGLLQLQTQSGGLRAGSRDKTFDRKFRSGGRKSRTYDCGNQHECDGGRIT